MRQSCASAQFLKIVKEHTAHATGFALVFQKKIPHHTTVEAAFVLPKRT
jgi:hypothetical protein